MKNITIKRANRVENTDKEMLEAGIVAFQLVTFTVNYFGKEIETTHDTKITKEGQFVIGGCGFIPEGFEIEIEEVKEVETKEDKEMKVTRDFSALYVPNVVDNLEEAQEWVIDNAGGIEGIVSAKIDEDGVLHIWSDQEDEWGIFDEWQVTGFNSEYPKGCGTKYTLTLECVN